MPEISQTLQHAATVPNSIWRPQKRAAAGMRAITEQKGMLARLISWAFILYLLFYIVGGALPQLEMLLTHGQIPIVTNSTAIMLPLTAIVILLRRRLRHNPLLLASFALIAYAIIDGLILMAITHFTLTDIRLSLRVYLLAIAILGLCASAPVSMRTKPFVICLMVLFFASVVVSTLQFVTNSPVIATHSVSNNFAIPSFDFGGRIRAFSLFNSGLHAGIFYCLTAALGASLCLTRGRRSFGSVVLALSVFGCFATFTRLTMIGLVACVVTAWLLHKRKLRSVVPWIPIVWALLGVIIISKSLIDSGQASGSGIGSTSSIEARLMEWRMYSAQYTSSSFPEMAFGSAISPWMGAIDTFVPATAAPVSIDNGFLEILLNSGAIGLLFVVFFCWTLWRALYKKALATGDHYVIAATSIFAVLPFFASINDLLMEIFVMALLALFSQSDSAAPPSPVKTGRWKAAW